jgi:hypothetical protein
MDSKLKILHFLLVSAAWIAVALVVTHGLRGAIQDVAGLLNFH